MTITLSESAARREQMRKARKEREVANRVGTSMKPHLHEIIEDMAVETKVSKSTMVRILLLEAIEGRGVNLDKAFREWKAERNAGRE